MRSHVIRPSHFERETFGRRFRRGRETRAEPRTNNHELTTTNHEQRTTNYELTTNNLPPPLALFGLAQAFHEQVMFLGQLLLAQISVGRCQRFVQCNVTR